jgi:hypothetical protein
MGPFERRAWKRPDVIGHGESRPSPGAAVRALPGEAVSELDVRGIRFQRMSAVVHRQDADATPP